MNNTLTVSAVNNQNDITMIDEKLFTKALRKPLKRFILRIQKTLDFNQKQVYTTAKMSSGSYKRFFDGEELWRGRERIIIACVFLLRDARENKKIDEDGYKELNLELLHVCGDVAIVANDLSFAELKEYLNAASQSSRTHFNNH